MNPVNNLPFLTNRDPESHKGDYGHALLVAGSYGKMGAAVLAARACLRAGVGLLTVRVPRSGVTIMQTAVPEAMLSIDEDEQRFSSLPEHLDRYDAIAVGPGIGTEAATQEALARLLTDRFSDCCISGVPLVLDADALNIISLRKELLAGIKGAVVTPHLREYQRLFGDAEPQPVADRHGLVLVMKGHNTTVYAQSCRSIVNHTGNAGMATAGSGDVLTGVTLALLAQDKAYAKRHPDYERHTVQQLAAEAVCMHGAAGDRAAQKRQQYSVVASDIIDNL